MTNLRRHLFHNARSFNLLLGSRRRTACSATWRRYSITYSNPSCDQNLIVSLAVSFLARSVNTNKKKIAWKCHCSVGKVTYKSWRRGERMPRAKSLPQKLVKVASCHPSTNTWVFLMKGERENNLFSFIILTISFFYHRLISTIDYCRQILVRNYLRITYLWKCILEDSQDRGGQSEIVRLRHPASDKPAVFVFGPGNITVQEVLIFDEKKRSWFIDNNVKSDGKLHLSTPIDPIFLVLPYLRKVIVEFYF